MTFWNIIKDAFKKFYESLFFNIIISLIWFAFSAPIMFLALNAFRPQGITFPLLIPLLLIGPFTISGMTVIDKKYCREPVKLRQFFTDLPPVFIKGIINMAFAGAVYAVLLIAVNFYLARSGDSFVMLALTALVVYFLLYFTLSQMLFWGLSVVREEMNFLTRVKYSLLIPLDNLFHSAIWLLIQLVLTAGLFILIPGLPVLFFSLTSLLIISGTRKLLDPYVKEELQIEM